MGFFEQFFNISDGLEGEVSVLCPFPHYTANGIPYQEHKESASVNLTRRLFHCKVCEAGYNERQFIKEVEDCSLTNASRLETIFKNDTCYAGWTASVQLRINVLDNGCRVCLCHIG